MPARFAWPLLALALAAQQAPPQFRTGVDSVATYATVFNRAQQGVREHHPADCRRGAGGSERQHDARARSGAYEDTCSGMPPCDLYVLGFTPSRLDGQLHTLEVRTRDPRWTVRARRHYLAPKAPGR